MLIKLLVSLLPWTLKRWALQSFWGYEIHPSARIGFSWVYPARLIMEDNTSIGHLSVCKNLGMVHLKSHATIGRGNWITGYPPDLKRSFAHKADRRPALVVGEHSAITNRHLIDCTDAVTIGRFTTVAGFRSQLLAHSIDLEHNRQDCAPISVGDYCFVGTNAVLLGGSTLPSYSVLGAKSLLNKSYSQTHRLYAGVPARPVKELPESWSYFSRAQGFVD